VNEAIAQLRAEQLDRKYRHDGNRQQQYRLENDRVIEGQHCDLTASGTVQRLLDVPCEPAA